MPPSMPIVMATVASMNMKRSIHPMPLELITLRRVGGGVPVIVPVVMTAIGPMEMVVDAMPL